MNELKRACLTLLTLQAWLETIPPSEAREALKPPLESLLFWYREPLSKRWMHTAGVLQLNDWKSAWRARERSVPNEWLRDVSLIDGLLPQLTAAMENPRDYGLRMPHSREQMHEFIKALLAYRATAVTSAGVEHAAERIVVQDELQIYFERVASAVR